MIEELQLRLLGAAAPSGEIPVRDLAALAGALQELSTRIARDVVDGAGPGRSTQFVEELAELRLTAVESGSTVLLFSKGPLGKLDFELADEVKVGARFWEIIEGIAEDRRPESATELISQTAAKLLSAIKAAGAEVVFSSPGRHVVTVVSDATHLETWSERSFLLSNGASAAGRLEKVDLHSHSFRLRDAVGNAVTLKQVKNDSTAGRLIGQWVVAEGVAEMDRLGRLIGLQHARVEEVVDPAASFVGGYVVSLEEILATAPGPELGAGIELTDDEFADFLRAARS